MLKKKHYIGGQAYVYRNYRELPSSHPFLWPGEKIGGGERVFMVCLGTMFAVLEQDEVLTSAQSHVKGVFKATTHSLRTPTLRDVAEFA